MLTYISAIVPSMSKQLLWSELHFLGKQADVQFSELELYL